MGDRREFGDYQRDGQTMLGRETALTGLVQQLRARSAQPAGARRRPRVGFVGLESSRQSRVRDLADSGLVDIRSVVDGSSAVARDAATQLRNAAPNVRVLPTFDALLQDALDGIVIGSPAAQHVEQASAALGRGIAVFCHHPLAARADEVQAVVSLAQRQDRLLGVDLRFRQVSGVAEMAALVRDGAIGDVYAAELDCHSAYGSNDLPVSGCLLELGSHLVDLLLHVLDAPPVHAVRGRRYLSGRRLPPASTAGDDHASAELELGRDITARLACSWRASTGQESVLDVRFTGTRGALRLRNVLGSATAFRVEHFEGTRSRTIGGTLDAWAGGVACTWARRLATDPGFDESALRIPLVSTIIESIAAQ